MKQVHPDLQDLLTECDTFDLCMRWFKASFGLFLGVKNTPNPERDRALLLL